MGTVADGQAPQGSSYADQRPSVVVESLGDLRGPTSGVVSLDRRLHWSGTASFNLEIGLRAGGRYGFALAGGHAVAAHGILQRPSEDVDLFADWQRRADFPAAADVVITAYKAEGYEVRVDHQTETFACLHLCDPATLGEQYRVELVANWRIQPPVQMDIGPVLMPMM